MSSPAVAIIIPFYNDEATIAACIRSVFEHTRHPDWKVIVVDDGSSGVGLECLADFPAVELIRRTRGGVAAALNTGIAAAPGRDIIRLHADVVVETPDWISLLQAVVAKEPRVGVVGARLVYPDGRIHSEGRSIVSGFGFHPQHRNRRAYQAENAGGKLVEVDSTCGGLAYYRREAIEAVGGLDERYGPAWFEDDDFCFAVRWRNFKVFVEPAVKAVHFTRSRTPPLQAFAPNTDKTYVGLVYQRKQSAERLLADIWEHKWGWHPLYPDLNEVRRIYGDTEVCWQIGERLRFKPVSDVPTVDCCLVTYNLLPLLKRMLASLAATDYPADRMRVYVTNNGSSDGTLEYLRELRSTYPLPLEVINLAVNTGVAPGLNFAITAGRGDLVSRLDDDVILPPNWLKDLVADLFRRPFAGCVGTRTVNDDERAAVQWACPQPVGEYYVGADETDAGQANYFARAIWSHGCCNLYRRDAIVRCGLVDLRYSPSQWDDIDHNIALVQAGYEILYDGRIRVVHKKGDGLNMSAAAIASGSGNGMKIRGKWGADFLEVLDTALLRSREGRCLPADGDTTRWMARGPAPREFPRAAQRDDVAFTSIVRLYDEFALRATRGSELYRLVDQHLEESRLFRQGNARFALDVILLAINFTPERAELYRELAEAYIEIGVAESVRSAARRGIHLLPGDARLHQLSRMTGAELASGESRSLAKVHTLPADVPEGPGEGALRRDLRVLFVGGFQPRPADSPDLVQMEEAREQLRSRGIHVDVANVPRPDVSGYDLVHAWGCLVPYHTLPQLKGIRAQFPDLPIVLTPNYSDPVESDWACSACAGVLKASGSDAGALARGMAEMIDGMATSKGRLAALERVDKVYRTGPAMILSGVFEYADHLIVSGESERAEIGRIVGGRTSATVVPPAADEALIGAAGPGAFVARYRRERFALMAGPLAAAENAIALFRALGPGGMPVVAVGPQHDLSYLKLCQRLAPRGSLFIDHLTPDLMASAFAAASVFVRPAWSRSSSWATAWAAHAGTPMVLSANAYDSEHYKGIAQTCDPASPASIAAALVAATADERRQGRLLWRERHGPIHGWNHACSAIMGAYQAAIASRRMSAEGCAGRVLQEAAVA